MKIKQSGIPLVCVCILAMTLLAAGGTSAADLPSPADDPAVTSAATDIDAAREVVAELLRDHDLTEDQIQQRLANLSDEDVLQLSQHANQIQEGGAPPNYIWILLGVLIAVTILATVF